MCDLHQGDEVEDPTIALFGNTPTRNDASSPGALRTEGAARGENTLCPFGGLPERGMVVSANGP